MPNLASWENLGNWPIGSLGNRFALPNPIELVQTPASQQRTDNNDEDFRQARVTAAPIFPAHPSLVGGGRTQQGQGQGLAGSSLALARLHLSDLRPLLFGDVFFFSIDERLSGSSRGFYLRRGYGSAELLSTAATAGLDDTPASQQRTDNNDEDFRQARVTAAPIFPAHPSLVGGGRTQQGQGQGLAGSSLALARLHLSDLRPLLFGDVFFFSIDERLSGSSRGFYLRRGYGSGTFRRRWLFRVSPPHDTSLPAASYDGQQ
nr:hypothetical protein Iba_chr12bCG15900 [Ipomoea batatas]